MHASVLPRLFAGFHVAEGDVITTPASEKSLDQPILGNCGKSVATFCG
jgi:hypothetical protein